jgi:hypothetical protein
MAFVLGLPPPDRYSLDRSSISNVVEPTSYRDATVPPEWQLVMTEEYILSLISGFIRLRPTLMGPLSVTKLFWSLVAFTGEHVCYYDETLAPMAHMITVGTLLIVESLSLMLRMPFLMVSCATRFK